MQQIPNIIKNLLKRNLTFREINFLLNSKDKNVQHLKTNLRIIMENTKKKAKDKTKGRKKRAKSSKKDENMTEENLISIIDKAMSPHIFRLEKKIDENKADTDRQIAALREDQISLRKMIVENKADTDRQITALRNDVADIRNDVGSLKKDMKIANKHLMKIDSRIDNLVKKNNLKE